MEPLNLITSGGHCQLILQHRVSVPREAISMNSGVPAFKLAIYDNDERQPLYHNVGYLSKFSKIRIIVVEFRLLIKKLG